MYDFKLLFQIILSNHSILLVFCCWLLLVFKRFKVDKIAFFVEYKVAIFAIYATVFISLFTICVYLHALPIHYHIHLVWFLRNWTNLWCAGSWNSLAFRQVLTELKVVFASQAQSLKIVLVAVWEYFHAFSWINPHLIVLALPQDFIDGLSIVFNWLAYIFD